MDLYARHEVRAVEPLRTVCLTRVTVVVCLNLGRWQEKLSKAIKLNDVGADYEMSSVHE